MTQNSAWTRVITRHFLAKVIILSMALSSGAVWLSHPTSASDMPATVVDVPGSAVAGSPAPVTSVRLTVGVLPSRLIVVDSQDRIAQVWSNTFMSAPGSYTLRVRLGDQHGEERLLTDDIRSRYDTLSESIDWSKTGLVYRR